MWECAGRGTDRGNRIKLLDVCDPVLLTVEQLAGTRVNPATGRHMHLVYTIDTGVFRPAAVNMGGTPDRSIEVVFDLRGSHHLNWPGSVYLTDGDPTLTYQIESSVRRCAVQFQWHPLSQYVAGLVASIPAFHSRMRTHAPAAYTDQAGFLNGTLDHNPIPCTGNDTITFAAAGNTLISEWWG